MWIPVAQQRNARVQPVPRQEPPNWCPLPIMSGCRALESERCGSIRYPTRVAPRRIRVERTGCDERCRVVAEHLGPQALGITVAPVVLMRYEGKHAGRGGVGLAETACRASDRDTTILTQLPSERDAR